MLKLAMRYSGWMFAGFTALFLLMHLLGLSHIIELRTLNAVIHLSVLWFALRAWLYGHPERADNYPGATALGVMTSVMGAFAFGVFFAIFLGFSPGLLEQIRDQSPAAVQPYISPVMCATFILIEGTAVGLIASYIISRILEARYYRSV